MPAELAEMFPPDRDGLLRLMCGMVTPDMLVEIADADYGYEADEHLAALKKIVGERHVPEEIGWYPRECLELIRWSQPEHPSWQPGATGLRGHTMRGFCCAALMSCYSYETYVDDCEPATLIQMIFSALALGKGVPEQTLRFLSFRVRQIDTRQKGYFSARDYASIAFGFVGLCLLFDKHPAEPFLVSLLVRWLFAIDEISQEQGPGFREVASDVFREIPANGIREQEWLRLVRMLKDRYQETKGFQEILGRIVSG